MVTLTVHTAGKGPLTVEIPKTNEEITVKDVKEAIAVQKPKLYPTRQKLSIKGDKKALSDTDTLATIGVSDGGELALKDLGPQISWRTVFVVEYIGPLIIHPIFYFFPRAIYGGNIIHSELQKYTFALVMLHFLKREYETLCVHRFSHATMPLRNIFKNSGHYHILSGVLLAGAVYRPKYSALSPTIIGTKREQLSFLWFYAAIFMLAEISNLKTHLILRSLRPEGTGKRAIPRGFGFNFVTCPNYFFESVAWFSISMMTGSLAAWLFWFVSTVQMISWANKKHRNYKKEFGSEYPKGRKIMFPFIY